MHSLHREISNPSIEIEKILGEFFLFPRRHKMELVLYGIIEEYLTFRIILGAFLFFVRSKKDFFVFARYVEIR